MTPSSSSVGEFFAVDRRCWARACTLGLNAAVAYLVLARFSDRMNRATAASVNAAPTHVVGDQIKPSIRDGHYVSLAGAFDAL